MKRFIVFILSVSVFFVGLGAVADGVGARFKSDEKALDIVKKARIAIGGEAAIREVRGMVIKGQTSHTFKVDGAERTETGETEIAMQLPDKLMKMVKIGNHDGAVGGDQIVERRVDVVVTGKNGDKKIVLEGDDGEFTIPDGKKIIVRKAEDGEIREIKTNDDKKVIVRKMDGGENAGGERKEIRIKRHGGGEHSEIRQNELLRTTLALLLTAPDGMDVSYTFAGESTVDGTSANAVVAAFAGSSFKLYFDRSSNLPLAMSFVGHPMPVVVKFKKEGAETGEAKDVVVFDKKIEGPGEGVEHFVRFSDYRGTNGVQLPYKWTTSVGDKTADVFDVTSYEINPANIADRFKDQKVFVRTAKPVEN